jgi:diguanylate cyclase (GGDEF)-like protein/PAS domain S-box-containing protein
MRYNQNIVTLSLIAAFFLWVIDAMIDAVLFHKGTSPIVLLFSASPHELYSRSFMIAAIILFGAVISKMTSKGDPTLKALKEDAGALHINERRGKKIRGRLQREEEPHSFLRTIFNSIHDPFSIVDRGYTIIKVNDAYAHMKGRSTKDLIGKPCYEVLHGRTSVCKECVVEKTFRSSDPCAKEKLVTAPDGSEMWMEIYTYPIFDEDMRVSHVIEYARDITDRKMVEEEKKQLIKKLNHLSTTDSLTGLLNRRALNDILDHEIDRANRYSSDLSLIICDIDRFKQINDTYGHRAGDLALRAISGSFKSALRKADILGRYGGDEFMIILPETSIKGAKSLAEKVRMAVENTELELPDGKVARLSTSIGVASCCAPVENIDTIVARADAALYTSKQSGRNRVSIAALQQRGRARKPDPHRVDCQ